MLELHGAAWKVADHIGGNRYVVPIVQGIQRLDTELELLLCLGLPGRNGVMSAMGSAFVMDSRVGCETLNKAGDIRTVAGSEIGSDDGG